MRMLRHVSTFLLLVGFSACSSVPLPGAGDPYAIPYELLSENEANRIRTVMSDPTCSVDLPRTPVRSTTALYVFLMDELPFTAGVLRELGESKYEISRASDGSYLFDDREGLVLRAWLVRRDEGRWIWVTDGAYSLGLFGSASGRSVIIVRCEVVNNLLLTEARLYAKVSGRAIEDVAKALRGVVENVIRNKSFIFIKAARLVAEIAARDPAALAATVRGSEHVHPATLEEFERRFVLSRVSK